MCFPSDTPAELLPHIATVLLETTLYNDLHAVPDRTSIKKAAPWVRPFFVISEQDASPRFTATRRQSHNHRDLATDVRPRRKSVYTAYHSAEKRS